jgi:diguanylate cyclase (GGDEF)-like protein
MARYDMLTGLTNRGVFIEVLQHEIARARRDGTSFAVLYVDLDHFKDVNDTLGHPVGDLLLQSIAQRLQASVREMDTVSRFGGDEFAIIVTDLREPEDAAIVAGKAQASIAEPVSIQGIEVRSGASVGIAVYGPASADAETLLSHADVALYRAKAEGRGTYRFFTDEMDAEVRTRFMLGAELRGAIVSDQLFLEYQPEVDAYSGRIVGLEALVRWLHPTRGLIPPGQFIPVAEKSGSIVAVGHWVMREALGQMRKWLDAGVAPPLIAVNVSALQFKTPRELENDIAELLSETCVPPRMVELELTESALMDASREHGDVLLRLRRSGIRIAIDDFGIGYSSLDYLRRFPVDRIKIAQQFMFDLTEDSGDAIVKAAIALAHELKLDVIVEGVETAKQLQRVKSCGGLTVQGYYFSKPLPAAEMTALLNERKSFPLRAEVILKTAVG